MFQFSTEISALVPAIKYLHNIHTSIHDQLLYKVFAKDGGRIVNAKCISFNCIGWTVGTYTLILCVCICSLSKCIIQVSNRWKILLHLAYISVHLCVCDHVCSVSVFVYAM